MVSQQPAGRPGGRAMVVGSPSGRAGAVDALRRFECDSEQMDDPYAAMAELCARPLAYRHLVLCVGGLFREELRIVAAVKRRFPHINVWLAQTDGCAAGIAEAARLGADGLLDSEGLHPFAPAEQAQSPTHGEPAAGHEQADPPGEGRPAAEDEPAGEPPANEAVLTAEELRALLADVPAAAEDEPATGT